MFVAAWRTPGGEELVSRDADKRKVAGYSPSGSGGRSAGTLHVVVGVGHGWASLGTTE